ncbi:DUF6255 family natural product biosynthesis protein [Streptomyces syringium]|uniref:DUF6255 family natural product biosynthesis protein n=1 Tax=Streptomyces syringium TaxID=76729 RepID=UPI003AAF3DB1
MRECGHRSGWACTGGEARCGACGVVRFTEYGALRPPGLPQVITPGGTGRADRAAARVLSRIARRPAWWGQRPGRGVTAARRPAAKLYPTVSQPGAPRR